MRTVLELIGLVLIIAGVGWMYVPAALVLGGVFLYLIAHTAEVPEVTE